MACSAFQCQSTLWYANERLAFLTGTVKTKDKNFPYSLVLCVHLAPLYYSTPIYTLSRATGAE